ncbi:DNA-processing protein DprA [Roseivivax sediminis]|uniref:DNA processing protein n=1 Tax=Roseivivax sediminis TaxID=936889 RepID=A0A1I1SWS0_9RHOB|nr:DNA-processing protein DprA [Roseivivax sediminis]SFD49178.1 DNA processing protein [Roseivivax sediminis]
MVEHITSSTHPLLPPTTEDDRLSWLRLLRSRRVGNATFFRLMGEYGSASAALAALPDIAREAGLDTYEACSERVARAEIAAARHARARMICYGEPAYPARLAAISDPPPFFWAVGEAAILARPAVAMVGARNASSLGLRMARLLARELGEAGVTVVSGLARGIDAASHAASLSTGTAAVLGGGVDVLYPTENARLAEDIPPSGGVRLSEQAMGLQPQARHFPARNRLISGLAEAVVVVEAAAKSGSLITARAALDQGREVLAVPGHPLDARSGGTNLLLRDGARLVRSAADVIEALPNLATAPAQAALPLDVPGAAAGQAAAPPAQGAGYPASVPDTPHAGPAPDAPRTSGRTLGDTATLHRAILDRLGPSPVAEDQLVRDLGAGRGQVARILTDLELSGEIRREPGGLLARTG